MLESWGVTDCADKLVTLLRISLGKTSSAGDGWHSSGSLTAVAVGPAAVHARYSS